MDSIGNVSRLLESLRKQVLEAKGQTGKPVKTANVGKSNTPSSCHDINELRQRVRNKLCAIDAAEAKAPHKGMHVFLETVLLWEFGDKLLEDPKFYSLLEDMQRDIESDRTVSAKLENMISLLRA